MKIRILWPWCEVTLYCINSQKYWNSFQSQLNNKFCSMIKIQWFRKSLGGHVYEPVSIESACLFLCMWIDFDHTVISSDGRHASCKKKGGEKRILFHLVNGLRTVLVHLEVFDRKRIQEKKKNKKAFIFSWRRRVARSKAKKWNHKGYSSGSLIFVILVICVKVRVPHKYIWINIFQHPKILFLATGTQV